MGLAHATFGFVAVFSTAAVPILLRGQGVGVEKITQIVTLATSPMFWVFLLSPVMDVWVSRRVYTVLFACVAAVCLGLALVSMKHLVLFTVVLVLANMASNLYHYALNSWLTERMETRHYAQVGAVTQIANLGAGGVFSGVTIWTVRTLPLTLAAAVLALLVLMPMMLTVFLPAAQWPTRTAREVFRTFFRDLYTLCKRQRCRYGLLVFLAPVCSFALPFGALGSEFHVPERWVATLTGPLAGVMCGVGCLGAILFCRWIKGRTVYVLTGLVAAVVTGAMMLLPHTMAVFAVGGVLYMFLQGVNYASFTAVLYEIVGRDNPLRGTQIGLLSAASNLPISLMTWADGVGFGRGGVQGMLGVDTFVALAFCVPVLVFFARVRRLGLEEGDVPVELEGMPARAV
jgi:PAT family beta-lactamase induction signal transducer AmpG